MNTSTDHLHPHASATPIAEPAESAGRLIACRDCDLLQQEVRLARHADAHCVRCGARLYRGTRTGLTTMLSLMAGCAVLMVVANLFPIALIEVQGAWSQTTLAGASLALWQNGRPLVAIAVGATTIALPALEVALLLYLLIPLRLKRVPPGLPMAFRLVLLVHPWSMMEIFLLGVLVTLVKLGDLATVVPGASLWAFCGLIVLFTMAASSFSVRDFWRWADSAGADWEGD
ncbi:paraquat-inducible protein A [Noviherbaspirillum pedocola]|uniref:Paraquat-inducible protein A n=1 Tax=Noviherbaspirillum pedocola TaxID=2801341 RepID=A0A934W9C7_9BURK|nr:paraquat-inducible protein A [Noviherbaspirillum pedocola]MBK4736884.1 paraquat-inducible protein A [Noviherbaspirillum pedocola]